MLNGINIHADKDDRYDAQEGAKITQQCFVQAADGTYAIDTAATTHARGYDVLNVAAVTVAPPTPPQHHIGGDGN